jgi:hypothetical protein
MDIAEVLQHTSPELFLPELEAGDKPGVLTELVAKLVAGSKTMTRPDAVLQMLESREALGSTAVGPGVAFPHGRTLAVQKLTVLCARSSQRRRLRRGRRPADPPVLRAHRAAPGQRAQVHQEPGRPDGQAAGCRPARPADGGRRLRVLLFRPEGGLTCTRNCRSSWRSRTSSR